MRAPDDGADSAAQAPMGLLGVVDCADELIAEARTLCFVPFPGSREIGQGISDEPDPWHWNQPWSRRLASSHVMTSAVPRSRESRRRSSSAF